MFFRQGATNPWFINITWVAVQKHDGKIHRDMKFEYMKCHELSLNFKTTFLTMSPEYNPGFAFEKYSDQTARNCYMHF